MTDAVLLIMRDDVRPVLRPIIRRRLRDKADLLLHGAQNLFPIRFSFKKLNRVSHQFRQKIVTRKFPPPIRDTSRKRRVFSDMPRHIEDAFGVAVILILRNIRLENSFSHRRLEKPRKQKQPKIKDSALSVRIRFPFRKMRKFHHTFQQIGQKEIARFIKT